MHCHANWAQSLGGISFPLLADFHPKGEVARSYGAYLEDGGITDRATVLIDADGIVRHASSVTPDGQRDINELASLCEEHDKDYDGELAHAAPAPGFPPRSVLYVKNDCGFSRAALLAHTNLHLEAAVTVKNVSEDVAAMNEMKERTGNEQAPALIIGDKVVQESAEIVAYLVDGCTPL